jgi:phospho-N-acetylmuramoyl-pentapeptide-transferase
MVTFDTIRVFLPALLSFLIGIGITPFVSYLLYKYKFWKSKAGKTALDGLPAAEFNRLHESRDTNTPRGGGIIVWGSVLLAAGLLQVLWLLFPEQFQFLSFISRNQTWVPLTALIIGACIGFFDDLYEVRGHGGLKLRTRLAVVCVVAVACAWWFYDRLDVSSTSLLFFSEPIELGALFIPFFILVALALYAGSIIDGIDGLSGGVYSAIFAAYAGIAFFQNQMDIAALCAAIVGGLLAFLWFNIPPARFYLSETGTMALSLVLVVVVFLTDTRTGGIGVSVLPIIALPLVATVASSVLQVLSKKLLGRKILRIAPLHHHFEAIGWPPYKVTMRYWVVSIVCAVIGLSVALL